MATSRERLLLLLETKGGKQAVSALDELDAALNRTNNTARNSNGNYKKANEGMRMMRGGAAQLGYQIQDVAVQLSMGQNAMMVFAQQGSQIASLMGTGGALFGAVLAIVGGLAGYVMRTRKATETTGDLAERVKSLGLSYDELTEAQREYLALQYAEEVRQQEKQIARMSKELDKAKELQKQLSESENFDTMSIHADSFAYSVATVSAAAEKAAEETEAHAAEIDTLRQEMEKSKAARDEYINGTKEQADALEKAKEAVKRMNEEQAKARTVATGHVEAAMNEYDQLKAIYSRQQEELDNLYEQGLLSTQMYLDSKSALYSKFQQEIETLTMSQTQLILQATQQQVAALSQYIDKSSAAGKALFLVQQGLAAAQAIISGLSTAMKIKEAYATLAAATGNIGLIAAGDIHSKVAATMGFVTAGAIMGQTLASFEGGGYTGNRPRVGGMDGKGGFLAMLHPNESVTDHTKGGGAPVSVNFTINAVDTRGFEDLLATKRGMIMSMVNDAVNNRGRASLG